MAPISTTATADFAGCAAYAHTFYKKSDPEFAQKLLDAAIKAQNFIDSNPDFIYKNPPEITTGGYGDRNITDEKYFACSSSQLLSIIVIASISSGVNLIPKF